MGDARMATHNFYRAIRRSPIDNEVFLVRIFLRGYRKYGFLNRGCAIEADSDDGDFQFEMAPAVLSGDADGMMELCIPLAV